MFNFLIAHPVLHTAVAYSGFSLVVCFGCMLGFRMLRLPDEDRPNSSP